MFPLQLLPFSAQTAFKDKVVSSRNVAETWTTMGSLGTADLERFSENIQVQMFCVFLGGGVFVCFLKTLATVSSVPSEAYMPSEPSGRNIWNHWTVTVVQFSVFG